MTRHRTLGSLSTLVAVIGMLPVAARPAAAQESPAAAQAHTLRTGASPFVPLDDAAYHYVDALMARGLLNSLPALDRPYTTAQLRAAMTETANDEHGRVVRGWLRALAVSVRRLEPWTDSLGSGAPSMRVALIPFGTAETSSRRELMRPDESSGVQPGIAGRVTFAAGPVVSTSRLALDQRLRDDPDFHGSQLRGVAGRLEEGYISAQWRFGSLFLGRQVRNWGPWALPGLQLGSYAYSWDHVAGTLGTPRIALTSVVARLDPYAARFDSGRYERHLAMHRVRARLGGLELAVSEGVVYGGVGRGTELAYVNPLALYQLAQYNETGDGNVGYSADIAWRLGRRGVLAAQLLVDDLQIDRCVPACAEPASLGWTLSGEGLPLFHDQRWFGSYTRVTNLTYRSPQPWERWTSFDVGLGRGFSDYDEARIGVDLALLAQAPLRTYAAYRRQGMGDYRLPFPPETAYAATPGFLAGLPERTLRFAIATGVATPRVDITADLGWNRSTDADHARGRVRSGLVGRVRATFPLTSPDLHP